MKERPELVIKLYLQNQYWFLIINRYTSYRSSKCIKFISEYKIIYLFYHYILFINYNLSILVYLVFFNKVIENFYLESLVS